MRATNSEYRVGDIFPLKTEMERTVYCEILDTKYTINQGRGESTFLFDEHAIIAIMDMVLYNHLNAKPNNILNTGIVRTGKSTFSQIIGRIWESSLYRDEARFNCMLEQNNFKISDLFYQTEFDYERCCFEMEQFHDVLSKCRMGFGDIAILDEAGFGMNSLEWWSGDQIELVKELPVIAKLQAITQFNTPHKDYLNNRVRDSIISIWNYTLGVKKGKKFERGYVECRIAEPSQWYMDTYWSPYVVCRFPQIFDEKWLGYEEHKDAFIKLVHEMHENKKLEVGKGDKRNNGYMRQRNALILHMIENGAEQKDIATILAVKQSSISQMLSREKDIRDREEYTTAVCAEVRRQKEKFGE